MDPDLLTEIHARLERLDERYAYRLRPRPATTLSGASSQKLEERTRDLADYALELSQLLRELLQALGARRTIRGAGPPA